MNKKLRIAITHGDTNGIGYELILKTFAQPELLDLCTPIVYGSEKVAAYYRKALELDVHWHRIDRPEDALAERLNLIDVVGDEEVKIEPGRPSAEAGRMAFRALEAAAIAANAGSVDAIVTCPINKADIQSADFRYPGHTEFFQEACGGKALMVLLNPLMRVALVTTHLPLSEVAEKITPERVEAQLRRLHATLLRDFCITAPRIAVLGLNPHNGDEGLHGREEVDVITPLLQRLNEEGLPCFGPYSADGFFGAGSFRHFDAVLAMYHDQGLAPFKALSMDDGVNFTAGLHIVRTSPDHGTAYDIAGKGVASTQSFVQAIYTAIDVCRNRLRYDEMHANPLPFAPRERREDRRNRPQQ